jgi:Rrf2 family protein
MLDLAIHSNGTQVSLLSIAQRQNISVNYLEQVFSLLRKAGLVNSVKGASGGYMLAENPSRILVGDILKNLEGDLMVVDEETDGGAQSNAFQQCIKRSVWDKFNSSIDEIANSVTIADLVDNYRSQDESPMFYI